MFVRSETYSWTTDSSEYSLEFDYYEIPVTYPGRLQTEEMAIQASFAGGRSHAHHALVGTDLWEDGGLDSEDRRTYFGHTEPVYSSE